MKTTFQRKRLWVDPAFQGRLLLCLAAYLGIYTFVAWHLGFLLEAMKEIVTSPGVKSFSTLYLEYLNRQLPLMVALFVLLPPFLYNLLKFSHRVAGPLFRCRRVMREMAAGQVVPEFTPRKHDLMGDLFAAFNALIQTCNARAKADEKAASPIAGPEGVCTVPAHDTPAVSPSGHVG